MPRGPKEWSPRRRVRELEALARDMVGDGRRPNIFFVTDEGNVVMVTLDFDAAYAHWRKLAGRAPRIESALEDRRWGTVASVEPESDDPGARLIIIDDSGEFLREAER